MSTSQNSRGIMSTYTKIRGGGVVRGILPYTLLSKQYQSAASTSIGCCQGDVNPLCI